MSSNRWVMPEWMKQYEGLIRNTGGNTVERLVNGRTDPGINLPLAVLEACVYSQVELLEVLHEAGLLKEEVEDLVKVEKEGKDGVS